MRKDQIEDINSKAPQPKADLKSKVDNNPNCKACKKGTLQCHVRTSTGEAIRTDPAEINLPAPYKPSATFQKG